MAQTTATRAAGPGPAGADPAEIRPRSPSLRGLLLAATAGAALTLAFPPYDAWPVAVLGVAGLALLTQGRSVSGGATTGLVAGLGFFIPLLHWTGVSIGPAPWLLLAFSQAGYLAGLGAASALVQRLRWWPLWVAALWVGQEALRVRMPYGGFPWGRLAFSQADAPTAKLAALSGAPLVTFAVAGAGALLAWAITATSRRPGAGRAALAGVGGIAVAGTLLAGLAVPSTPPDGRTVQIGLVQGNVPRLGLDFNAQREAVLRNHTTATAELAGSVRAGRVAAPDLVVWPENSSDLDPYADRGAAARISTAVRDIGVPVLVGAVIGRGPTDAANTGIVWDPLTGPGGRYVKRHPVPFGEYIPLRRIARLVSSEVDRVPRDFVKGPAPGVLRVGPATLGDVICFEIGYDEIVRDTVTGGGQVLAVQTNNATFGFTPQTEQQLAMSRLRALEHARTVLVAATSGVSAVVGPDGAVRWRAGLFSRATTVAPVTLSDARTLGTRVGGWPELALTALGVSAILVALLGEGRSRRRASRRPALRRSAVAP